MEHERGGVSVALLECPLESRTKRLHLEYVLYFYK